MKKVIADKWIEALRSGKYRQGTGGLSLGGRYCCLGVLCELAVKGGQAVDRNVVDEDVNLIAYGKSWSRAYPPSEVLAWSGMRTEAGYIDRLDVRLADMNDYGYSFAEIADTIEKHWNDL